MNTKVPFGKTYTSSADLVRLLQARGLEVQDSEKAQSYLDFIDYYRLSAYMYPRLEQTEHHPSDAA